MRESIAGASLERSPNPTISWMKEHIGHIYEQRSNPIDSSAPEVPRDSYLPPSEDPRSLGPVVLTENWTHYLDRSTILNSASIQPIQAHPKPVQQQPHTLSMHSMASLCQRAYGECVSLLLERA